MSSDMSKDDTPMFTKNLKQPVRSKLFNRKNFVKSFDINFFIHNETILPRLCENSPFLNPEHGNKLESHELRVIINLGN